MSKLTRQDFYCGAGLALLFRKNEHISPSLIENVNDVEGKNVVGIFYKIKTQSGNEAIIYIKFSANKQSVKNLSKAWKFSLSDAEKDKIRKQSDKRLPFFIILICIDEISRDNITGEIALLTQEDYDKISNRTNIIIGLWSNNDDMKAERQKVYVLKQGKGNSREYYIDVKRRKVETALDKLIDKYYPAYNVDMDNLLESDNTISTELKQNILKIKVAENPKWCSMCQSVCTYNLVDYIKNEQVSHKINVATCSKCGRNYIKRNFYTTFIKNNNETNIVFDEEQDIYLLNNNEYGCKRCDAELVSAKVKINIYHDITSNNNYVEKDVEEDLFYCKSCKLLYANNIIKSQLLSKYGINKIPFKYIEM